MGIWQDLRYALRIFTKSRGFSAIALITLALGIGASTAAFSVVDAILLKPLPYPNGERIVIPWRLPPPGVQIGYSEIPWGIDAVHLFQRESKVFESVGAFKGGSFNLVGAGDPAHIQGVRASAGFFPALGVAPAIGRFYTAEEDRPGSAHQAILSDRLWRDRFRADPAIVGRAIQLNGEPYTVVGVMPSGFAFPKASEMPASFQFPREPLLWVPLAMTETKIHSTDPDELAVVARLKPCATTAQAQKQMDVFSNRLEAIYHDSNGWFHSRITPLARQIAGETRTPLMLIVVAVAIVLLIACANVAGLLLTRALGRRREFTLRAALGAGNARLVRQLLTESVTLAAAGGIAGLAAAKWAIDAVRAYGPPNVPRLREATLDGAVFLFALGITVAAGIFFGLAPVLGTARDDLAEALNSGGQRTGSGPSSPKLRNALMVFEIALAMVLTVAAGLLVRTFDRLLRVDGGFNPARVVTFELSLPENRYTDRARMARLYEAVLQRLRRVPGVESAGIGETVPLGGEGESTGIRIPGKPPLPKGQFRFADFTIVSPGYFAAIGTPLLRGRAIEDSDIAASAPVTVINKAMADKYWPGESPIGRQVGPGSTRWPAATIVGIVANVKHMSLRDDPVPEMYVPYTQDAYPSLLVMQVALRTRADAASVTAGARTAVRGLDPEIPMGAARTLSSLVDESMTRARLSMLLVAAFGVMAVLLAAMGMYGVVSYSVMQRTREIGVRMALGAERRDIFGMALRQGAGVAVLGIAIGLAAAIAVTRLMKGLLFGVGPSDPLTFAAVAALLSGVVLAACYVPARRAVKVDPTVALRWE